MKPQPGYGFDSYKGSGKLKNKVVFPMAVHHHNATQSNSFVSQCCPVINSIKANYDCSQFGSSGHSSTSGSFDHWR